MIISASYRTDIPAFYGEWFLNRLDAGYVRTVNPYNNQISRVELTNDQVDGFVFWTRNLEPFFPALNTVSTRGFSFVVQYTVTGYPRALDAATIARQRAIAQIQRVAADFGSLAAVWRYDPIVFSSVTPPDWHRDIFADLCRELTGVVDEVVVSFAQVYRKTRRNMSAAARALGFEWWDPSAADKHQLLTDLAAISRTHGIALTVCGQPELLSEGVGEARCVDASRLSRISGQPVAAMQKPHRRNCGCWASRDIGDYDTCPHGCVYCYAVHSRDRAKRRFLAHDPDSDFLLPSRQNPQP